MSKKTGKTPMRWRDRLWVLYAVAITCQLPMLALFARDLWMRPHYRFAPLAFLVSAILVYRRWPEPQEPAWRDSRGCRFLLMAALVSGLAGYLTLLPWFAACSVLLLVASFLAGLQQDGKKGQLWIATLPAATALVLPFQGDLRFLQWLENAAAGAASRLLDVAGQRHHFAEGAIQIPGNSFSISEACSDWHSFFLLAFLAITIAVWNRRSVVQGGLLVVAAGVWTFCLNLGHIALIPTAERFLEIDLSAGGSHTILSSSLFIVGFVLLWSTDQFLLFMLGPVEENMGHSGPFGDSITFIWNHIVANHREEELHSRSRRHRERKIVGMSRGGKLWILVATGLLSLAGVAQSLEFMGALAGMDGRVSVISTPVIYPFEEQDLPSQWTSKPVNSVTANWERTSHVVVERSRGVTRGSRSDSWVYTDNSKRIQSIVSLDQTFPGWHELTSRYQSDGWELVERVVQTATITIDDKDVEWPFIEATLSKPTGEQGLLLFGHFDAFGKPIVTSSDRGAGSIWTRVRELREQQKGGLLFQSEAYQTQVFHSQFGEIPEDTRTLVRNQYLTVRAQLRQRFVAKRNGKEGSSVASTDVSKP